MRPSWSGFQFPTQFPFESVGGRLNQAGESAVLLDVGLTVESFSLLSVTVDVLDKTDAVPLLLAVGLEKTEFTAALLDVGISRYELVPLVIEIIISLARQIHARLYVGRADGQTWEDVTDYLANVSVSLGDIGSLGTGTSGVDGVVRQMSFSLHNEGEDGFSPRDRESPWNQFDGRYSPLLWPNREVMLDVGLSVPNKEPQRWYRQFHGYLGDSISTEGAKVTCECRDLAKRLQDHYVEEQREYGSEAGVPAETVIQQILNDNLGVGVVTLYCPVSPGFMITPFEVEYQSVWDAIQKVASQIGWFLGYRWDPNTGEFRLTLMDPPRWKDATTADFVLAADDDFYLQELDINDTDIRNAVRVTYRDKATGKRNTVIAEDTDSIQEYGRRAMQVEEADTSLIDTQAEAEAFAQYALADLKDLTATTQINMPFMPQVDVFAGILVEHPRISSTRDFFGVESVRHTLDFASGRFRTDVTGAGRVVGAHQRWLDMETRPGAKKPIESGEIAPGAIGDDRIRDYTIGVDKFMESIKPPILISSLPVLPDPRYPKDTIVFLITEQRLYSSTGNDWKSMSAADFSELSGQIVKTQISDGAIETPHLAANAVTADKLTVNTTTTNKIIAGIAQIGGISTEQILISSGDGKTKFSGNALEVRDANNVLRVRLGRLS